MALLSPLPPFQVPLHLPLLLRNVPLSPVPVRDRLPANVLVVLCACRSVGNKLSPTVLNLVNSRITRDLSEASPKTRPARPAQALRLPSSGKRAKAFINLRKLTRCLLPRREPASLRELTHSAQSSPLLVCICVLFGTLKYCSISAFHVQAL